VASAGSNFQYPFFAASGDQVLEVHHVNTDRKVALVARTYVDE